MRIKEELEAKGQMTYISVKSSDMLIMVVIKMVANSQQRSYSRYALEGISVFGKMIRHERLSRRWTAQELADRIGIARNTLQKIEGGDTKVEIGLFFEAASILGIKLFEADDKAITALSSRIDDRIAVLPKHVHKTKTEVKDDF